MKIECNTATEWLITLHSRYNSTKITLNESEGAFTAIYNPTPKRNMIVGSFNRVTKKGSVLCRRQRDITPEVEKRGRFTH